MKGNLKGLVALTASAVLLAASVPLFLSAQEEGPLIPPSSTYYILGNGLGYADGDAADCVDWAAEGMAPTKATVSPDGKGASYQSVSKAGGGGEITFKVKTEETPFKDATNVAFWMKTPPKGAEAQSYAFFVDVNDGTGWKSIPASDKTPVYYDLIGMDGSLQPQKTSWATGVPLGFEGYFVVDISTIADFDPAKLQQVRIREDYGMTHMTGQTVYVDNIGAVTDVHGFANALKEEADAGSVTSADCYLVGNPLSRREDITWSAERVNAATATVSPDGACMSFQPSAAPEGGHDTDDSLLFNVLNDKGQWRGSENFAFWVKMPDVGADKFYSIFLDAFCQKDTDIQFSAQGVYTYYLIGKDGTLEKKTSDYTIGLPSGFEGYVVVETATYAHVVKDGNVTESTPIDTADLHALQIRSDWNQAHMVGQTVYLDNFGTVWDTALFAKRLAAEWQAAQPTGTTTEEVTTTGETTATTAPPVTDIHESHPDNQGMVVGCGFEKDGAISEWTTKALDAKVVKDVSPDEIGAQFTLQEGTQGEFYVNITPRDEFAGTKAIVFWFKSSDAPSQFFFDAASIKKDDPKNNFEKFAMPGGTTSDIITVSAKDGTVVRRKTAAKVDFPANFEGYVILPATNFSLPMGDGYQQTSFTPDRFNLFCIRPEWNQANQAGKTFSVDDFGLTADVDAYVKVLQDLYGDGSIDPSDHAHHPDNKGAAIGCGFESETDFSAWTSKEIKTAIVKNVSPDGSCGQFTLGMGTRGELYMNVNPDPFEDYNGKAIVFWVKAPDADGFFYAQAASNKADGSGFEKFGLGSGKVEFVSAKNGSVVEKDVTGGLVIPANFEGYVILPTALFNTATGENFEAEALVPERFVLFALNPNWDQAEIQNKSYCIDDIGLVADVNAYTAMLSDLYQSDEPDNPGGDDEPGGDDTPDYTVTSSSGKVVIDGVMIRVAKGMTVREVLACLQVADSYTLVVVDRDGNEVTLDAPIAAGMRLKVMQEDLSVANYNFALTDAADIGTVTTSGEDDPGDSTKTGDTWPIGMLVLFGISMAATVALVSRRKPV